jgi:GntR family transcriptional repressor for pyruvate dehydrogenase complex
VREALTAVTKTRVSGAVVQQLQGLIRDGVLTTGERLPGERELAARLRVSRMSVREALRLLEVMGQIRTDAGRGTFVVDAPPPVPRPVPRERLDLLEDDTLFEQLAIVREAIEPRVAALAARHAMPETADA